MTQGIYSFQNIFVLLLWSFCGIFCSCLFWMPVLRINHHFLPNLFSCIYIFTHIYLWYVFTAEANFAITSEIVKQTKMQPHLHKTPTKPPLIHEILWRCQSYWSLKETMQEWIPVKQRTKKNLPNERARYTTPMPLYILHSIHLFPTPITLKHTH